MPGLFSYTPEEKNKHSLDALTRQMNVAYRQAISMRNDVAAQLKALSVDITDLTSLYASINTGDGFKSALHVMLDNDYYDASIEAFASNDEEVLFQSDETAVIHKIATIAATNGDVLDKVHDFISEHGLQAQASYIN